jgi:hypothetical protein
MLYSRGIIEEGKKQRFLCGGGYALNHYNTDESAAVVSIR